MADPVSWKVIKPGWKVEAADGSQVGEVDEITGDDTGDLVQPVRPSAKRVGLLDRIRFYFVRRR